MGNFNFTSNSAETLLLILACIAKQQGGVITVSSIELTESEPTDIEIFYAKDPFYVQIKVKE